MTAQLRSELRKLRSTRTNLGLVALILFGVIAGAFGSEADLSDLETQRELVGNGWNRDDGRHRRRLVRAPARRRSAPRSSPPTPARSRWRAASLSRAAT